MDQKYDNVQEPMVSGELVREKERSVDHESEHWLRKCSKRIDMFDIVRSIECVKNSIADMDDDTELHE